MSLPSYLFRNRYQLYYFRYSNPKVFQPFFQQKEFRRSLKTRDKQKAINHARLWLLRLEFVFSRLNHYHMDYNEIRKLLEPTIQGLPMALEEQFHKDGPLSSLQKREYEKRIQGLNGLLNQDLGFTPFSLTVELTLIALG